MEVTSVDGIDHPLAADFVALNDPVLRREVERRGNRFVVEGVLAIQRLIELAEGRPHGHGPRGDAGGWRIRSLLLNQRMADRLADQLAELDVAVGVAEPETLRGIVGFDIHRGALASVDRKAPLGLADLDLGPDDLIVVVEGVNDHENLGAIYRNAAAFGAVAVVLDPGCADPFYRRSVRVSLGHVLSVPTVSAPPLPRALALLGDMGVRSIALSPTGSTDLRDIAVDAGTGPRAVVVGAEGPGLAAESMAAADLVASIEMAADVDSLNVAVATAVALHHLQVRQRPDR